MKGQAQQQPGMAAGGGGGSFDNKNFLNNPWFQGRQNAANQMIQNSAFGRGFGINFGQPGPGAPQAGISAGAGPNAGGFIPPSMALSAMAPGARVAPPMGGSGVNAQGWVPPGGPGGMAPGGPGGPVPRPAGSAVSAGAGVNAQGFIPPGMAGPVPGGAPGAAPGAVPGGMATAPPTPIGIPSTPRPPAFAVPGSGINAQGFIPPGAPDMTSTIPFQGNGGLPAGAPNTPQPSSLAMALNPYLAMRNGGFGGVPFAPLMNRYGTTQ